MTRIRTALHFALLYHHAIRVPTILFSVAMVNPLYFFGRYTFPKLLIAKVLLSVVMIAVNHLRSPNNLVFFLNMRQDPRVLWATYFAVDMVAYLMLATLILFLR